MSDKETTVYELQNIDGGMTTLKEFVTEIWTELKDPSSEAYALAKIHQIDPDSLPTEYESALQISKTAAGFEASVADMVLTFASGALAPMAKDVWKYIILPQLRHRIGDKALVEKSKKAKAGKDK